VDSKQILVFLSVGINFCAHAAQIQQEIKEREEKTCAQQATQAPSTGKIKIAGTQDLLDIEKIESFTDKTFATLIKEQWSQCDPYLLARVVVFDKNGNEYPPQYYDAHAFIQDRLAGYPLNRRVNKLTLETTSLIMRYRRDDNPEKCLIDKFNPHNKQIDRVSVLYFEYDPQNQEDGFTLLFTEENLLRHDLLFPRPWLEANQNFTEPKYRILKAQAQLFLGELYLRGDGIPQNEKQALAYFERAASQTEHPLVRAQAQEALGRMYFRGLGVPQDFVRARGYFELAIPHTQDQQTYLDLGEIYYHGRGVEKNYEKALSYFQQATWSQEDPGARAQAELYLGTIYLNVKHDYKKAEQYLQQVIRNKFNQEAKAEAQKLLKELAAKI
jgi:tetratricopeptide (TPR) repeat protein